MTDNDEREPSQVNQDSVSASDAASESAVTVIDMHGRRHEFRADDFEEDVNGAYLHLVKDGKRVGRFTPGYIGVFKTEVFKGTS